MRSCKSVYDRVKIQSLSRKRSHISETVSESEAFPFSSDSTYDSVAYDL